MGTLSSPRLQVVTGFGSIEEDGNGLGPAHKGLLAVESGNEVRIFDAYHRRAIFF